MKLFPLIFPRTDSELLSTLSQTIRSQSGLARLWYYPWRRLPRLPARWNSHHFHCHHLAPRVDKGTQLFWSMVYLCHSGSFLLDNVLLVNLSYALGNFIMLCSLLFFIFCFYPLFMFILFLFLILLPALQTTPSDGICIIDDFCNYSSNTHVLPSLRPCE